MPVTSVIWDLDGTLLDTLGDLAASTNAALASLGLPQRSIDEVRAFVGNGVAKLMERAVPKDAAPEIRAAALEAFIAHYAQHSADTTAPYPGVMQMLDELGARGIKMAVVSNKIDFAVKALCARYFGDRLSVCVGDDPARRKKPAPDNVFEAMRMLGAVPEETVYIGDSEVDVETAKNAGLACMAVSWGFRTEECLRAAGAERIYAAPQALLDALEGM